MKRLFYFTGHRFIVYHFSGHECLGRYSFEPGNNGFEQFNHYLENADNIPVRLLIDIIEEDFRAESIPHVFGADHKAVTNRLIDRHYRDSRPYVYYEKVGREKKGRRDDRILVGAVTNPGLLRPWLDIIEEHHTALCGIWSLPLLSRALLGVLHAKRGAVLLVSQQVNSNLRQSFFYNGKLLFSRQSVINLDASDISRLGDVATNELSQTINFLKNQRFVSFKEKLKVHLIVSREQIDGLKSHLPKDEYTDYEYHLVDDVLVKLRHTGTSGQFSDSIFAWLCMRSRRFTGHYGGFDNFLRYYQYLTSKMVYAASIVIAVALLVVSQSLVSQSILKDNEVVRLNQLTDDYTHKYKAELEALEPRLEKTQLMKSSVIAADRVEGNRRVSPAAFYIELSKVLSQRGLRTIRISEIDWKVESVAEVDKYSNEPVVTGKLDVLTSNPLNHVAVVKGLIPLSDDMIRLSVNQIKQFIDALDNNETFIRVEAIKLPVDIRSNRRYDSASELIAETGEDSKKRMGEFILKVVMKGSRHV